MAKTPNVSFKRPELAAVLPQYEMIGDAVEGSLAVKSKKTRYLPKPNAEDTSIGNERRYKAYLTRAMFYGVTGRTLRGLVGQMFMADPVVEVPASMAPIVEDVSGEGVSAVQLAKSVAASVISLGRAGLFVDYPATNAQVTREQIEQQGIRPTIASYAPDKILNWRTKKRGAISVLSLVVLEETYTVEDDGFEVKLDTQWRVLQLSANDVYTVEIWRENANKSFVRVSTAMPLDASGNPFNNIPFCFIGAENNDNSIDPPPLFDLADLNFGHYRNSADHEENLFISAQATPVVTGLTEAWADKYYKQGVGLGARATIALPVGGNATLIQAETQSAIFTEMEHKERQMVALGARLVEQKQVQRTAAEATQEKASENSVLANVANNISLAFQWALGWAALYMGVSESAIKFEINTDFEIGKLTPQERAQTISEWQAEAITFSEMRAVLRKSGHATLTDEQAEKAIRDAGLLNDPENSDETGDDKDPATDVDETK